MKISNLVLTAFLTLLLSACGGGRSSSDSSFTGTTTLNGNTYTCTTENDLAQCTNVSSCNAAASCTCEGTTCDVDPDAVVENSACSATTLNKLADGASCTFNNITYTCTAGTVSGGGFSSGGTISLNDFSVTCE